MATLLSSLISDLHARLLRNSAFREAYGLVSLKQVWVMAFASSVQFGCVALKKTKQNKLKM